MKRLQVGFIIEALIVLALIIIIPFTFKNEFTNEGLALYITSKVIFGILFIAGVCYGLLSKAKTGSSAMLVGLASLYQLIPLGIRYIALANFDLKWLVGILIIAFALIVYVAFIFGFSAQDKLAKKREEVSEGKTIEIQEEKRLATDKENQ